MGIQKDAHLDGSKYNWLGTILYIGVLAGEYPTNLLAQKLPLAKYLSLKYVSVDMSCSTVTLLTVRLF